MSDSADQWLAEQEANNERVRDKAKDAARRVVAAVGAALAPMSLDLSRLQQDLDWTALFIKARQNLDDAALWRERHARVKAIAAQAERLSRLLSGETGRWAGDRLGHRMIRVDGAPALQEVMAGVELLGAVAGHELIDTEYGVKPEPPWPRGRSAFEWLAGERLPRLYEKHFGGSAGYTRNDYNEDEEKPKANGPFIRFASAALLDLGIRTQAGREYSPDSIAKALADARSGKRRRRDKASSDTPEP